VLLVKLDDSTVGNAVADGHFASVEDSPRYAISMGAELVYEAPTVVLLANGPRKTGPVAESVLGAVTCDVPISYGQKHAAEGGNMLYVLDEAAAAELLAAAVRSRPAGMNSSTCVRHSSPRQRGGGRRHRWRPAGSACTGARQDRARREAGPVPFLTDPRDERALRIA